MCGARALQLQPVPERESNFGEPLSLLESPKVLISSEIEQEPA